MPGVDTLEVTTPELAVAIGFGKKTDPSDALKKAGVAVKDVDIWAGQELSQKRAAISHIGG
jgi:hypothetical protein